MSAESGQRQNLRQGLTMVTSHLLTPFLEEGTVSHSLAHHPSVSGWDLPIPSLHAGTEFLNKDPPWMIALCRQYQESGERTGLAIPGLQTTMIIVTLTDAIEATFVFHKDQKAEQLSTSHPAAAASKLCSCGPTVTTEVPTVLLGALDTSTAETLSVCST